MLDRPIINLLEVATCVVKSKRRNKGIILVIPKIRQRGQVRVTLKRLPNVVDAMICYD